MTTSFFEGFPAKTHGFLGKNGAFSLKRGPKPIKPAKFPRFCQNLLLYICDSPSNALNQTAGRQRGGITGMAINGISSGTIPGNPLPDRRGRPFWERQNSGNGTGGQFRSVQKAMTIPATSFGASENRCRCRQRLLDAPGTLESAVDGFGTLRNPMQMPSTGFGLSKTG